MSTLQERHCYEVDFTKALEIIEHNVIIQMMKHLGFDNKWCDWSQRILASRFLAILLNGVPGNSLLSYSCWQQICFSASSIN
jgi:hypothetical protein